MEFLRLRARDVKPQERNALLEVVIVEGGVYGARLRSKMRLRLAFWSPVSRTCLKETVLPVSQTSMA